MKISLDKTEQGSGDFGLLFGQRVFSVVCDDDTVTFREECDGYFFEEMPKEQAIGYLEMLINYIKTGNLILSPINKYKNNSKLNKGEN